MAKLYFNWITAGKWTMEQVPPRWVDEVKGLLDAAGYAYE